MIQYLTRNNNKQTIFIRFNKLQKQPIINLLEFLKLLIAINKEIN